MKEIQYILMGIVAIILIATGFPVGDAGYLIPPMPATYIGFIGLVVWLFMIFIMIMLEGMSPQILTNEGNWSLNRKDIHPIPWLETIKDEKTNKVITERIGDLLVKFPGGIDKGNLNPNAGLGKPIFIGPEKFMVKEGLSYHDYTNYQPYESTRLKLYIQEWLWSEYPARMRKKPVIYYGTTSHLDFSDTLSNLMFEQKAKQENADATYFKKKWQDLMDAKQREKNAEGTHVLIGKEYEGNS